jgi:hypothetical protein
MSPDESTQVLGLDGGGTATVVSGQSGGVQLRASRPFPPGSTLLLRLSDDARSVRIKVRGSRLVADGDSARPFRVEGRFVDLTKDQRALLFAPRGTAGTPSSDSGVDDGGQRDAGA